MTDEPEHPADPKPIDPAAPTDAPDPNLITTHSFGSQASPVEEDEAEREGA